MRRLALAAIGLVGCVQPVAPAEPAAAPVEVVVDGCSAAVVTAPAEVDAGADAPADPAPAEPGPDPQAFLDDAVEPALARNRDAIGSCVPRGVRVLDVGFAITSTGDVESILVEGSLGPAVQPCLAGILRGLALPGAGTAIEQARCRLRIEPRGNPGS